MKTRVRVNRQQGQMVTGAEIDHQIYTTTISAVAAMAGVAGILALASLIGGVVASGGVLALLQSWSLAVFGS